MRSAVHGPGWRRWCGRVESGSEVMECRSVGKSDAGQASGGAAAEAGTVTCALVGWEVKVIVGAAEHKHAAGERAFASSLVTAHDGLD